MINVDHGEVSINGFGKEILAEATIMLEAVYDTFEKQGGEDFALACIAAILENYRDILQKRLGIEDDDEEIDDLPMQDSFDGIESNFDDIDPLWWD